MDLSSAFTDIINEKKILVLHLNHKLETFSKVFSKFEVITALDFLKHACDKFQIPELFLNTDETAIKDDKLYNYYKLKENRRKERIAPPSKLDKKFEDQFANYILNVSPMRIESPDVFMNEEATKSIRASGKKILFITGFFTEVDVLRSSASALDHGYIPFVISDATSTYSERVYYEALDIISQYNEVIDSRDLMKLWPEVVD
ncbi:MAG: isochorismatase family protein [Thermoplasmatales archaeon]|nr:isochorismatase family protein [Thermoplasmatales archaeon]MCW6169824.1 isochorismatase family protein [Thermoplasmatales archaeon]